MSGRGGRNIKDHTNKKYGRLTVIKRDTNKPKGHNNKVYWICQCACGNKVSVRACELVRKNNKKTASCGCNRAEKASMRASPRNKKRHEEAKNAAKVLLLDIETAPMLGYVWSLWENNVSLDQLYKDWHVLSWSAKWLGDKPSDIMYMDQRKASRIENDKAILSHVWRLLDEADIVITQNGKAFDHKKLNARFLKNGMKPPSTYRHIDTMLIAKKHFAFTSNKLEYMSNNFCTKFKKLKPKKFPGFAMWLECMAGNKKAWQEMEKYNKHDVLALEELYYKLIPWDSSINFNMYTETEDIVCSCGSHNFHLHENMYYTNTGKFYRYICDECGGETRSRQNLMSKNKKSTIRVGTTRS